MRSYLNSLGSTSRKGCRLRSLSSCTDMSFCEGLFPAASFCPGPIGLGDRGRPRIGSAKRWEEGALERAVQAAGFGVLPSVQREDSRYVRAIKMP